MSGMTTKCEPCFRRQRGAATLVIVMVLFLVMALLAAYASRAVMFEQRISSSYFRANIAQEVAEAGVEWGIAQLNGEAVDANCVPQATGGIRFVDRYLAISAADRGIQRSVRGSATAPVADCVRSATGWACSCPDIGTWTSSAAIAGTDVTPSFGIRIQPMDPGKPAGAGTILLNSVGCTQSALSSCTVEANSKTAQGLTSIDALIALVSAVRSPPAAPLVVRGKVEVTAGGFGLHNTDPRSAGLLYDVGGTVTGFNDSRLNSVPGTSPIVARISGNQKLTANGVDVFSMFMGASVDLYKKHPSLRQIACSGGDCMDALRAAYAAGKRILWIDGDLEINSTETLGSVSDPVVIVADGDVVLGGSFQLYGMLVVTGGADWTSSSGGASMIVGMMLVKGDLATNGVVNIVYQPGIADQLRNRVGSFVRVPGGWTDTPVY